MKSRTFFTIKEYFILPISLYEAITCRNPQLVYVLMEDVPERNKIIPYKIIMAILRLRIYFKGMKP